MERKRLVLIIAGCLLPGIALTAILMFHIQVNLWVIVGLFLLCPVLHRLVFRDRTGPLSPHDNKNQERKE